MGLLWSVQVRLYRTNLSRVFGSYSILFFCALPLYYVWWVAHLPDLRVLLVAFPLYCVWWVVAPYYCVFFRLSSLVALLPSYSVITH